MSCRPVIANKEISGAVICLSDITLIQNLESQIRRKLSERGLKARYTFDDILHESGTMKETIETHRAITDAILCGDSMGAKCAMIMHLTYNRQKLLELIEQREKSSDKLRP